jgi:hypothetical protein
MSEEIELLQDEVLRLTAEIKAHELAAWQLTQRLDIAARELRVAKMRAGGPLKEIKVGHRRPPTRHPRYDATAALMGDPPPGRSALDFAAAAR